MRECSKLERRGLLGYECKISSRLIVMQISDEI